MVSMLYVFNGFDAEINGGQDEGVCECCGHSCAGR